MLSKAIGCTIVEFLKLTFLGVWDEPVDRGDMKNLLLNQARPFEHSPLVIYYIHAIAASSSRVDFQ
ncbi:hypothetical protein C5167_006451 [Papaver somniferum]|uniref:Uncharacterized protein n=1 Tax=Papaver somniferum TaxID=3469 RepID=A0A4Y7JEB0_PAPSO|nr:hypothetical protein C5167_006451 [Papaver somniferum]